MVNHSLPVLTDRQGYELKEHGSASFPLACYYKSLSEGAVIWHYHTELELILAVEGSLCVHVASHSFEVPQGAAFFINSGELHSVSEGEQGGGVLHSIVFSPRLIAGSAESIFSQKYMVPFMESPLRYMLLEKDRHKVPSLIEAAYRECQHEAEGYEFRVRNYLSSLMLELFSLVDIRDTHPSSSELRSEQRIKKMISFIQENAAEDIAVDDIAASVSIGRSECLRCFRRVLGTSPAKYLAEYRLEKAASLLNHSDMKIIEIGTECGFSDMSYFARVFASRYGCTPKEYRQRCQSLLKE